MSIKVLQPQRLIFLGPEQQAVLALLLEHGSLPLTEIVSAFKKVHKSYTYNLCKTLIGKALLQHAQCPPDVRRSRWLGLTKEGIDIAIQLDALPYTSKRVVLRD